jgi:transcriptional regulator GlxA family with amidase domain
VLDGRIEPTPYDEELDTMNRRDAITAALAGGILGAMQGLAKAESPRAVIVRPLPVPKDGTINVAFLISRSANVMDLAGPWETFQDVMAPGMPFKLYTVAESAEAIEMTGGLKIVPGHTFSSAPPPNVVVIGAQSNKSDAFLGWIREQHGKADVIMSVCTGAFKLALTGLLDGKSATTHHEYYDEFAKQFPNVRLIRGERFVDNGDLITAGGLTSGISAALHVIERYFGQSASVAVAKYMEFTPTPRPSSS